jgi:sec-independent protein translocase protein TatB
MFDIGFAELLLVGVVGLLVVGPEQLPGAVRTGMAWINRFRRSFDQIRNDVRRELHNDEVMQQLKADSRSIQQDLQKANDRVERELRSISDSVSNLDSPQSSGADTDELAEATEAPEAGPRSA